MKSKRKIPPENLRRVERELLKAKSPTKFVPELAEALCVSERTVWYYLAIVRKRLAERFKDKHPEVDLEIAKSMLLTAFATGKRGTVRTTAQGDTITMPDAGAMVRAAKTYAEITGAAAPQKVEHSLDDGIASLLGEALKDGNQE